MSPNITTCELYDFIVALVLELSNLWTLVKRIMYVINIKNVDFSIFFFNLQKIVVLNDEKYI